MPSVGVLFQQQLFFYSLIDLFRFFLSFFLLLFFFTERCTKSEGKKCQASFETIYNLVCRIAAGHQKTALAFTYIFAGSISHFPPRMCCYVFVEGLCSARTLSSLFYSYP
eukprot:TRINITY_DN14129_c0_g1_i1.p1 TRINITY_DN14129_c0_g1~~TRINITY_DN14129_c0_g1_i1.p1  ORF type:complete len:110 (+),score=2.63 TRINITY_DN14129_c0_g1_i1:310-639(+)